MNDPSKKQPHDGMNMAQDKCFWFPFSDCVVRDYPGNETYLGGGGFKESDPIQIENAGKTAYFLLTTSRRFKGVPWVGFKSDKLREVPTDSVGSAPSRPKRGTLKEKTPPPPPRS